MNKNLLYMPSLDELLASTGSAGVLESSAPADIVRPSEGEISTQHVQSTTTGKAPVETPPTNADGSVDKSQMPGFDLDDEVTGTPVPKPSKDKTKAEAEEDDSIPEDDNTSSDTFAKDEDFGDRLKDDKAKDKSKKEDKTTDKPESTPTARDYSGFTEEEVTALKRTSNSAFNYIAPILREHKTLKNEVGTLKSQLVAAQKSPPPEAFIDEYGYANRPEYLQAYQEKSQAEEFINFYNQQLIRLDSTGEFEGLQTGADGQSLVRVPIKCKDDAEQAHYRVMINDIIRRQSLSAMNAEQRAANIKTNYQYNVKQQRSVIEQIEKKAFPGYVGKEKDNPHINTLLQTLGEFGQANNPLSKMLAYTYARLQEVSIENAKLKKASAPPPAPKEGQQETETVVSTNGKHVRQGVKDPSSAALANSTGRPGKNKKTFASDDELPGRF